MVKKKNIHLNQNGTTNQKVSVWCDAVEEFAFVLKKSFMKIHVKKI